jgi:hypothetical protein
MPSGNLAVVTNTPRPTIMLATVTPAPPTPTATETPGPCIQHVAAGSDLISLAWACGHRSLDVIPLILELNDLDAPEQVLAGQDIIIPWPTATSDPNAAPPPAGDSGELAPQETVEVASADADDSGFSALTGGGATRAPTLRPTETLFPGVMWHTVAPNQTMLEIIYIYNTSAEALSSLNREIAFSQCDYGFVSGGESCTVMLYAGQQIRVPAPTPTTTLSPTLSGSETPTPTLTPTFNAPSLLVPPDRALFQRGDLITLRWVGTGSLGSGEVYRVEVEDVTAGRMHTGDTDALYYVVPIAWQGTDGRRHEYRWRVSVIRLDTPDTPIFTTDSRLFAWEGQQA